MNNVLSNNIIARKDKEIMQEVYFMEEISKLIKNSKDYEIDRSQKGWFSVNNPIIIEKILSTLGDVLTREILQILSKKPQNASYFRDNIDCSKTSLYRKLSELEKNGFIKILKYEYENNRKIAIYESSIKEIKMDMKEDMKLYIRL